MISHRRPNGFFAYVTGWLIDWMIGTFIGVTGALVLLLITLWVRGLTMPM